MKCRGRSLRVRVGKLRYPPSFVGNSVLTLVTDGNAGSKAAADALLWRSERTSYMTIVIDEQNRIQTLGISLYVPIEGCYVKECRR